MKYKICNPKKLTFLLSVLLFLQSALSSVSAADIQSRSAVVMDAETGRVLYAKNPELRLSPASTTKLMTALVVVETVALSDVVTISRRAADTAPTKAGLKKGDTVTVGMLLHAALIKSANDAAVALAEAAAGSVEKFVTLMNRKAIALGLNDTKFINPNGLPGKGQYTTAYDLSILMRQAIRHPVLQEILGTRVTKVSTEEGRTIFMKNTNELLWTDDGLLGGKTGYTRSAKHCFVCAGERDEKMIIVALLGAPRRELLWKESEYLMDFGNKVMNNLEEPVVYLKKSDYAGSEVVNASYTKENGEARQINTKVRKTKKKTIER